MEDETTPLNSTEDIINDNIISDDTVSSLPAKLVPKESALKLQLLELYRSVDVEDHDGDTKKSNAKPLQYAFSAPSADIDNDDNSKQISNDNINDKIDNNNDQNNLYGKQLQLEEAEMISALHDWIEQKGKPAIQKVTELQMKCDTFEQELREKNLELTTLHDELDKTNREKNDIQLKYNELQTNEQELKQTINTLKLSQEHHDIVKTQLTDNHEQNTDQLKEYQTKIDEINKSMEDLKVECENLTKLNQQYMEQNNTLKTRIQTKDEQITELTKDRDDWEGRHDQTHQDLLDRIQDINQLNKDIANYKHQIELVQAGNEPTNKLKSSNMKTLKNIFHDSSGDILGGDSTTNITTDKGDGFYQQSNTNILTGIYGPSTTNIMTERDTGFAVELGTQITERDTNGKHKNRDSIDGDHGNIASLQEEVFSLQARLKEEKSNHLAEMDKKEVELEKVNKARNEMENEIKDLREKIDELKDQSSQQQNGGCKDCIIM